MDKLFSNEATNTADRLAMFIEQERITDSKLDVKIWMIKNQFSRRNLPTESRLALAYRFKEFEAEKAKARQLSTLKQFSEQERVTVPASNHKHEFQQ